MRRRRAVRLIGVSLASPLALAALAEAQSHAAAAPAPQEPALKGPDPAPHQDDIAKYPRCTYCGMDRRRFHHSRMLIHYGNDVPDGVCSLHCAAISLSLNIDAEPKAIWVADNAVAGEPRPLVDVDKASFVVGGRTPGVMTQRSKVAFGSAEAARSAQAAQGGTVADFDGALLAAYTDMSADVARIRKNRAARRARMGAAGAQ